MAPLFLWEIVDIYIAPIRGITTYTFRNSFYKNIGGNNLAITSFIPTTSGRKISDSHLKEILIENNITIDGLIPQFIGNRPEDFVHYAQKVQSIGFKEVNWNLGCPAPMIIRKRRGSALLAYPNIIKDFLLYYFEHTDVALSLKVRLGVESPDEIFDLVEIFNTFRLKSIVIHPRTATQMYSGTVDRKRFGKLCSLLDTNVVFSGDICSVEDYRTLVEKYPRFSGIMLGRGLVSNPFLALQIKGSTLSRSEMMSRMRIFHDDIYNDYKRILYGPVPLLGRMKELWSYMATFFDDSEKILKTIRKVSSPKRYEILVDNIWE